jgi:effector-binding domain-containing protein
MAHAVSIVATSPTPTVVLRETTTWERFPTLWGELLDEVWGYVRGAGVQAGRNVMVYLDDVPNVEVGVELEGDLAAPSGRIVTSALPWGRAATTVARGAPSPEGIAAAHAAVIEWCDANGHTRTGVRWEVYDHWRDEPDSFETAVYWLLAP